jgi:endonuclease YncB( thermonuclease family)
MLPSPESIRLLGLSLPVLFAWLMATSPGVAEVPAGVEEVRSIPTCGSEKRVTCVVDGDTVWVAGVKYRFEEIDTPEKGELAGCPQEALQAAEATERLAEILSTNTFRIEENGADRYGRVLARFVIGETTAGEILVEEGLARPWQGHTEDWCR